MLGGFLCWTNSGRLRLTDVYTGWFRSGIQTNIQTLEDPFLFSCRITGSSQAAWYWSPPQTFTYDALSFESHRVDGSEFKATVELPSLQFTTTTTNGVISSAFLIDQLFDNYATPHNPREAKRYTRLQEERACQIVEIIRSAGTGDLFRRRDTKTPFDCFTSHYVGAEGFCLAIYAWLPIWAIGSFVCLVRRQKEFKRQSIVSVERA